LSLAATGCATTAPDGAPSTSTDSAVATTASPAKPTPDASTADPTELTPVKSAVTDLKQNLDLWSRIRAGYSLAPLDSALIARHEQWFVNNPEYMQAMTERARLYLYYIVEEVGKRKMPLEIALLPAIESAYKPYAYSRAKAAGLWQFIAPTGRLYGLKANWWYDGRRDVMASTQAALDYLEKLRDEFNGDWHLALAAYNAGEGKIARTMEYNRRRGKPTTYQSLSLKPETVNYVPKLIAMANIVASPEKYGVQLVPIPNAPYFTQVDVGSQIDLGVVSRLTDVPLDELQHINPHLNRWATDPEGPHHLLVPAEKKDTLLAGLSNISAQERVQWRGHEIKRGETMHDIARQYRVTIEAIRSANSLSSNNLRVGQSLMIPVSSRPLLPVVVSAVNSAAPAKPAPSTWSAASGKSPLVHYVRAGETLWSIARRYGVLVSQIAYWNVLEPSDVLQLGQKLRIFPYGVPAAALPNGRPNG
jgi:membrane-bound lytic murein transglycosylase D